MNIASLLSGIAILAWLGAGAALVLTLTRAARGQALRNGGIIILAAVLIAVLATSVSAGLVFLQPEERGVVISALQAGGVRQAALDPGLHWILPFAEYVIRYPISKQTYTMSIASGEGSRIGDDSVAARTADGQEIFVDASVIFAVDPARVINVHIAWQGRYAEELVRPQSRGIIRDVVSQYGVDAIVSAKREEMTARITETLRNKLAENGILMDAFILRNITFSQEYAASVEQKQIAEQLAKQAAFVVEQRRQEAEQARQTAQGSADAVVIAAKGDAEARLINAEAEAKALKLIAEALANNPDLITYQYVIRLSPTITTMLVPTSNPFILPLPGTNPQP
ncbi:MAG: prohibitin family protein [Chloroflexi bacterium]|nr:prohibitin family protein [Chloroflexota bacterium]